jgi:hypothetical protein
MSIQAINAAWLLDVSPTARKLVLLYLANAHNGKTGQLNPSIEKASLACGMSPRQTQRHIHDLIDAGLVQVIGNHNGGPPGSSRHYRLNLGELNQTGDADDRGDMDDRGDAHDAEGCHARHGGVTPMTQTGVTHVTQTRRNQKEPESNQKRENAKRAAPISCPADVDQQVWGDWLALRKEKKAAVTASVLQSAEKEAVKAGMTLEAFLREWCFRGSQGLKAEWLKDKAIQVRRPAADDFGSRLYGPGGSL